MLRALKVKLVVTSLAVAVGVTGSASSTLGQEHAGHHAANKVVVDADILSAFVNKPCENFQLARKHFLSGNNKKAASSLRTALAFLRLEAARADAISQVAIEKSVNDLKLLASAVERGEVQAYSELQRAFVEAHVALASHHCVQSDTCCCQLEKDGTDGDVTCVCWELNAATIHLEQATMWRNGELAQPTYDESHFAKMESTGFINSMATHKKDANQSQFLSNMKQRIGSLHQKLEAFTGRKIQLARPSEIEAFGGMDLR